MGASDALRAAAASLRRPADRTVAVGYFLGLSLLVFYPLLPPGFVLTLDMVFSPHASYLRFGLRVKGPLYYGRLPLLAALDALTAVVPHWVVQKAALTGVVAGSGLAAYSAARADSLAGRLYAGTLYAVNPFVYVRLLAGHWYFLLGYAALPLAVVSVRRYVERPARPRLLRAAGWSAVVAAFDPHAAVLLAVAGACVAATLAVRGETLPLAVLRRTGAFAAVAAAIGGYWLAPAAASLAADATQLAGYGAADLAAFSAAGTLGGNVPLSVAALYGFWRGGYRYPFDAVPAALVVGAFAVLLFLAVDGWFAADDARADGLALVGLVGFVLALGVSVPATAPLFRWLAESVPGFAGMRDSQKFVGLLSLSYALLGARGVDRLAASLDRFGAERPTPLGRASSPATLTRLASLAPTALRVVLVACVVALPAAYAAPTFGGLSGQLDTTDYPADWRAADDRTYDPDAAHRVLFLPWHGYLRLPWVGRTVATPASQFFRQPTVQSRSLGVDGIGPRPPTPTHARVARLLERRGAAAVGPRLADLGVRYVVLSKSADYERYAYLRDEPGLRVVSETTHLVVFENERFAAAPPPAAWPRADRVVPRRALLVGAAVSLAATLSCAGVAVRRRRGV